MVISVLYKTKSLMSQLPLLKELKPGWPDAARLITQGDIFRKLTKDSRLYGMCLNAGCGEGLYSKFLESFQEISEIVNLDLTLPSIPEQRADSRHKAKQGSLTWLPFEDNTFDSCLCSEVIEHIEEDTLAISELARVIKPGGFLLVSVPTPPAPYDPAHVREGYTLKDLSELLTKNGFIVKQYSYCFHLCMRIIYRFWEWQFSTIGKGKLSYLPLFVILTFGYADKYLKFGKP